MATNSTTSTARFCRYCDGRMLPATEPSGAPCLECERCTHSVELDSLPFSCLLKPAAGRGSLRRKQMGELMGAARRTSARPNATARDLAIAKGLMLAARYISGDKSALSSEPVPIL